MKNLDEIMYEKLKNHIGHNIEIAGYGNEDDPENIAIECLDCNTVLASYDLSIKKERKIYETKNN